MKIILRSIFIILIGFSYATNFGKNVVQYEEFDWHFSQSQHFDIYISDSTGYHLDFLIKTSEDAYKKISRLMDWELKERVSIIIYSSHNDFQQTNVISSHLPEGVGGVTELLKNRVVIPFDGSFKQFNDVIYHELVHAFINDCVYGGNLKNMISNSIKVRIPLWMNEGLAEYVADKWDANSDMWIRDLVLNGDNLPHVNQLNGYWAYRGGQSVWNFIAEKWGEESISEIIKQIKITGETSRGLKNAISINIDELSEQWHKYLKKEYWIDINDKDEIKDISFQLTNHRKLNNHYNIAPSISPNGDEIAIFSDKNGIINLVLINSLDGKITKKIIQGERTLAFEELHILKPGITWSHGGDTLAVAVKSGHSDALVFIDLNNNKKFTKRFDLEGIFRPSWNPKKNIIAFIGNNGFSSDIYLYDLNNDSVTNITNDWFTDDQVSWDEDGQNLLFISNRGDYTNIDYHQQPDDEVLNNINLHQTDIYRISVASNKIEQLTATDYNESYPFYSNSKKMMAYISDKNGINNIFMKSDSLGYSTPITNVLTGITQLSWNLKTKQLLFTGFNNGGYDIFTIHNPSSYKGLRITDASWKYKEKINQELLIDEDKEEGSIVVERNKYKNYIFLGNERSISPPSLRSDNIQLDSKNKMMNASNSVRMFKYKTRYTLDYANVDYGYNNRRGSTGLVNFLFSDILGNHKVYVNTEMEIRIKSSDYLIQYHNLYNRTNYMIGFYHFGQEFYDYQELEDEELNGQVVWAPKWRYQSLGINFHPSYIINKFQRIGYGFDFERDIKQELDWSNHYDVTEISDTDYTKNFLIPFIEYTFDNTLWYETYPVKGRRISIKYLNSILNEDYSSINFSSTTFDVRSYSTLNNGVSTALRLLGGTFIFDNSQAARFRVGGTAYLPFFNEAQYTHFYDIHINDQVYYNTFIMPLRGIPIGGKYGKNVLLLNAEIRLPFLMYYFPAIKMLGKINGVLFSDIGVVWDDGSSHSSSFPNFFDEDSWDWDNVDSYGYNVYPTGENNPNQRMIKPTGWVWSIGLGPRFIMFGFPWQMDFAWQYNPIAKEFSQSRMYLSIGLDF